MDFEIINECTDLSLKGKISFIDVVKKLSSCGVERYTVDLVGKQKTTYGNKNEIYQCSLPLESSEVNEHFDREAIQKAIIDSQQKKITYQQFLTCMMRAGCCHYEVFIGGKKVIYFGRNGNYHLEPFPLSS